MGDNVIDDAQVIFEIGEGDFVAGGDTGKVILNSVTLTIERSVNGHSGIGNEANVAAGYGTRSANMDTEEQMNQAAAEMLEDLYVNDRSPKEISVTAGDVLETRAGKFDWDNLEVNIEDDGGATVSMSGLIRGLEVEANP